MQAGLHLLRTQGSPRGWTLKSILVNGRETIDTPIELRSGQELADVNLVFTDRLTEVNGTIADDRGAPITDYTLLAFPEDEELWRPQSRHIMTTRPDQNGKYQIRGLPPGAYLRGGSRPRRAGRMVRAVLPERAPRRRNPSRTGGGRREDAELHPAEPLTGLKQGQRLNQIVLLTAKMLSPGADHESNRSPALTWLPSSVWLARFCCHTTYSVLPTRHSHLSTTLLR